MNHKNNPWLSLVAMLLMALIVVITCTGCAPEVEAAGGSQPRAVITEPTETAEPSQYERFEVQYAGWDWLYIDGFYVITDTETGVQYLLCETTNGVAMAKLEG